MPTYTIETTYRVPVYRQRTYDAATPAEACRQAIEDDDWSNDKLDYEAAGETYVTGMWLPSHVLAQLQEDRVRDQIGSIIETDSDFAGLTADAVSDDDVHAACLSVAASIDLTEEIGAAEFRAALAALRAAQQANGS
ncbi:MAG TPA: hypothetical protein VKY65_12345 [Alphaproteobacteria bacterium]|nr:hypothetical protein [Alphaproteobacteria bacterium]